MPSLGQFAITPPSTGELRIFYKSLPDGRDEIKAITISNQDQDGRVLTPSLKEVNSIRASITGSGERTEMEVLSVAQRPSNFFYLDITDQLFNDVSGSEYTNVTLDPFLVSNFFNSEFSSLISNATKPRTSNKYFDVDREGGTDPVNLNALRGIEIRNFPFNLYREGIQVDFLEYPITSFNGINNGRIAYSKTAIINGSIDTTLEITRKELESALGIDRELNVNNPVADLGLINEIRFELASTSTFSSIAHSTTLAVWNQTGNTPTDTISITPVKYTAASGSIGAFIYSRLAYEIKNSNNHTGMVASEGPLVAYKPFGHTKSTQDFVDLLIHKEEEQPYARFAFTQDSNYSSTGIVNARYNGTKTSETDFGGISSAIAGRTFSALVFPSSSTWQAMYTASVNADEENLETLLHGGIDDVPLYRIQNNYVYLHRDYAIPSASDHVILNANLTQANFNNLIISTYKKSIEPGDVLSITSGSVSELMLVNSSTLALDSFGQPIGSRGDVFEVNVTRNYLNSGTISRPVVTSGSSYGFKKVEGDRVYRIEGSSVVALGDRKIVPDPLNFQTSDETLYINGIGYVADKSNSVTGSFLSGT